MTLHLFRDHETSLAAEYPEMEMRVEHIPALYKGKGNKCAIIGITCDDLHLTRDQRLELIGYIFAMPTPTSMKQIKCSQLEALYRFRGALGEAWTNFSKTSSNTA